MRSLIFLCFFGVITLSYASGASENIPKDVADTSNTSPIKKGPWSWEVIDGRKFKVYKLEDRIPHGFSMKVFIKKTRDHIINYIRMKKCGCRVDTTRKTWQGPHKKLWFDEKRFQGRRYGRCPGNKIFGHEQY